MSQSPTLPVPPGGDQNRGPVVIIVTWVFSSLALITFFLRLFTRLRLKRNPGWDDFWIGIAMFFNLTYAIFVVVAINAGNGRHAYYLEQHQLSEAMRLNLIAFIPGILAFSIPKLGVAILLMRLLNPSKAQRFLMYFLAVTSIIGSILCAILLWQQCQPPQILWDPAVKGKCWKPSILVNFATFVGAFSAFTDIYLAVYPCTVLYKLQISTKRKFGLSAVLSLGIIAGVFAIYKSVERQGLYDHADYTYSTVDLFIWASIESNFIIIAADLPTLRPVFQVLIGRSTTSQGRSAGQKRSSYKLQSVSGNSSGRKKKAPRELYPTDTIDLVAPESVERILPPNRIRKTWEVNVNHHSEEQGSRSLGGPTHEFGEV